MFKIHFLLILILSSGALASGEFKDYMLQSPKVEAPKRGSLKGEFSQIGEKALSLKTGSFSIGLPLKFPSARGNMQLPFSVNYSPSFGLTELGIGWSHNLEIRRVRESGVLNFLDDHLSTPWGKMIPSQTGFYYTEDVVSRKRLEINGSEIIVYLPDGRTVYYGHASDAQYFNQNIEGNVISWKPRYAINPIGHKTEFIFERENSNKESYLKSISYGGLEDDFQYQINFIYQTVSFPYFDYGNGNKVVKDKRIKEIEVQAKDAGAFISIYKYKLGYRNYKNSPGFHLTELQKFFSETAFEPKVMFNYDNPSDFLEQTNWSENPDLTALGQKYRTRFTSYGFTSLNDFNNDGRLDLELGQDYGLYHNTDTGFQEVTLPAPQGQISSWCLFPVPTSRTSRRFFQPLGNNTETFVYDLFEYGDETILDVCKLNGERVDYFRFPRFWEKGPKTIFSDINRDNKPDLIHLRGDAYEVIYNTSSETTISFASSIEINQINLPTTYSSFWVNDINGDGQQDLVLKGDFSLLVHFGMANGKFQKDFTAYRFYLPHWVPSSYRLQKRNIQFVDMNKDSLPDILMQVEGIVSLYINTGSSFIQQYVPGMFAGPNYNQNIMSGDISGDGNRELATTIIGTNQVFTLPLDRHGLGMLTSMDDGKGSIVSFEYGKSKAVAGVPNRKTIVTKMTKTSIGEGSSSFILNYLDPQIHNDTKSFLGFGKVESSRDNLGLTTTNYIYDSANRGLTKSSESFDFLEPNFVKYSSNSYTAGSFEGLDINYQTETKSGVKNPVSGELSELVSTNQFNFSDMCSEITSKFAGAKNLTTTKTFASVTSLTHHMTCFEDQVTLAGSGFSYNIDLDRDDSARVTHIRRGGILQQNAIYGLNGKLQTLWEIGKGNTTINYDGNYRISSILEPSGVETQITSYEVLNDSPKELHKIRPGASFEQSFRFDDLGRLSKLWHNLGNYTESTPLKSYAYEFASNTTYAAIKEIENIIYSGTLGSSVERFFWQTASGKDIAGGVKGENFTAVQGLKEYLPSQNIEHAFRSDKLANTTDFMAIGAGSFDTTSFKVNTSKSSYTGSSFQNDALVFSTNHKVTDFTRSIQNNEITEEQKINNGNSLISSKTTDAFGHQVEHIQEEGNVYSYAHDSLGRVTQITFPNSETQTISYHPVLGFVDSVRRQNIGSIEYDYDTATNLLSEQRFLDKNGVLENKIQFTYDVIGRVTHRVHTNHDANGTVLNTADYEFLYDGNYFNKAQNTTQLGHLTAIKGPKFEKEFVYAEDEQLLQTEIFADNKKKLTKDIYYYPQRAVKTETYTLTDIGTNTVLLTRSFDKEYNQFHGQLATSSHDSVPFTNLSFNDRQELNGATVNGIFITFGRDTNTSRVHSISENGMNRTWTYDSRDLIDTMLFDFGNRTMDKTYTYSPNGWLENIEQIDSGAANLNMTFSYDVDGIITNVFKNGNNTNHQRFSDSWKIGVKTYDLDARGRVTFKRGKNYIYGPTGRILHARKLNSVLATYYYDEENNPIVKIYKNGDMEFYFENSLIKENDFYQPISIDGINQVVGYYKNSDYRQVDADNLGSLIRNKNNFINVVTPYGERANRAVDDHDILDFTMKGYDKEIGAVRMGRRYYDPQSKRFLTPDNYFLENYEKTLGSPVEGNLYSYAKNNPISMIDPSGNYVESALDAASVSAGLYSISKWDKNTSTTDKILDSAGLFADVVALALPVVPGGAGLTLKMTRAADKARKGTEVFRASASTFIRTHSISGKRSSKLVKNITSSMKRNGWVGDPIKAIKINGDKYILDGHHRVEAARRAGVEVNYTNIKSSELKDFGYNNTDDVIKAASETRPNKIR